jgi:tetratricopeptide (TPR) repeat protein
MDRTRQRLLDEALRFFDKLLAAQGNDPRLLLLQAHTYYYSGTIHLQFNRFEDARNQYERGLKLLSDLRHRPDSPIPLKTLVALQARIQNQQGLLFAQMGDPSAARAELEAALALREQLAAEQPDVPDHKFDIVGSYVNLALIARTEGKADRTELYLGRARVQSEELLKKYPDRPLFLYYYTTVLNDLAVFYMEHRDYPSAVPLLERSVEHLRKLAESDAEAIYFRSDLARALSNLGSAWREQGYLRKAAGLYSEALALREHLHRTHPFIRPFAVDLAMTEFHIGEIHRTKDEFTDAVEWHTQAINRLDVRLAKAAIDTRARKAAFDAYLARSEALAALNKKPDALNDLNRAVELADDRHRPKAKMARALMLARTGKISDATVEADAALKMAEPIGDMLFDAARTYAIAAGADKSGKARHGARAVEMLTNAEKAGFFRSAAAREQLESNSDFQAIKNRGDFKSLSDRVRAMD